jgi:hypothetical protein
MISRARKGGVTIRHGKLLLHLDDLQQAVELVGSLTAGSQTPLNRDHDSQKEVTGMTARFCINLADDIRALIADANGSECTTLHAANCLLRNRFAALGREKEGQFLDTFRRLQKLNRAASFLRHSSEAWASTLRVNVAELCDLLQSPIQSQTSEDAGSKAVFVASHAKHDWDERQDITEVANNANGDLARDTAFIGDAAASCTPSEQGSTSDTTTHNELCTLPLTQQYFGSFPGDPGIEHNCLDSSFNARFVKALGAVENACTAPAEMSDVMLSQFAQRTAAHVVGFPEPPRAPGIWLENGDPDLMSDKLRQLLTALRCDETTLLEQSSLSVSALPFVPAATEPGPLGANGTDEIPCNSYFIGETEVATQTWVEVAAACCQTSSMDTDSSSRAYALHALQDVGTQTSGSYTSIAVDKGIEYLTEAEMLQTSGEDAYTGKENLNCSKCAACEKSIELNGANFPDVVPWSTVQIGACENGVDKARGEDRHEAQVGLVLVNRWADLADNDPEEENVQDSCSAYAESTKDGLELRCTPTSTAPACSLAPCHGLESHTDDNLKKKN